MLYTFSRKYVNFIRTFLSWENINEEIFLHNYLCILPHIRSCIKLKGKDANRNCKHLEKDPLESWKQGVGRSLISPEWFPSRRSTSVGNRIVVQFRISTCLVFQVSAGQIVSGQSDILIFLLKFY